MPAKSYSGTDKCDGLWDDKILVVARLPIPAPENAKPVGLTPFEDELAWLLAEGLTVPQIVDKVAGKDRPKRKRLRRHIARFLIRTDAQEEIATRAHAMQFGYLGASVKALGRKARAGRVDAIKLLFESSGFYNPRTETHHSGEVQITIKGLPRPQPVEDEVVDATVVEDD